jgi:hypothetical protein
MYYCQKCKKLSQPNESQKLIVVQTRSKTYYRFSEGVIKNEIAGHGTEIVRELKVCTTCAGGAK